VYVVCFVCNLRINYTFCYVCSTFALNIHARTKSYSKQLNNKTYQHCCNLKYVFLYTYKKNGEQTLIHTKVTLGEHDIKSMHLCLITTLHTTQVYTFKSIKNKNIHTCGVIFARDLI